MSSKAKLLVGVVVAIALAIPVLMILARDNRPDDVLIREALAESIEASREGRPGGVMDFISNQLKINQQGGISQGQIARWIRDNKPDVKVIDTEIKVASDGESAELTSDVEVKGEIGVAIAKQKFERTFTGVRMTFQKEDGRKFLIIPSKVWRLTAVDVPDDQLDFTGGF